MCVRARARVHVRVRAHVRAGGSLCVGTSVGVVWVGVMVGMAGNCGYGRV